MQVLLIAHNRLRVISGALMDVSNTFYSYSAGISRSIWSGYYIRIIVSYQQVGVTIIIQSLAALSIRVRC